MLTSPSSVCRKCAFRLSNVEHRAWTSPRSLTAGSTSAARFYSRPTDSSLFRVFGKRTTVPTRTSSLTAAARRSQSQFSPLVPPSPESLGAPRAAKEYRRTRKLFRRLIQLGLISGAVYLADTYFYDAALTRSFRTFSAGLITAIDYKINFRPNPPFADDVADVHRRNAERLFHLLRNNGGLYLKIGQAIAMQSAILPPEFQKMFATMFDDAPQNSWEDVKRVIREDFGKEVEEVFGVSFDQGTEEQHVQGNTGIMERTARASASVAQVHWARLADGREVAIKVQKREIARQVGWDLWAFKVVTRIYTYWFDIPLYSMVPYITERLMLETDFQNEAKNAENMRSLVQAEPRLRDRVYIPQVYPELSSKRVMTAEWIEGVRLWDKEGITGTWNGGWRTGSPGSGGAMLEPPSISRDTNIAGNDPNSEKLKPSRDSWKGKDGKGGLGLSLKPVMETMVSLFSAQMFLWGVVHCDPHPGNIFIRRLPSGKPELVLIDHGLYIQMSPKFRHDYALFWRSLMIFDNKTIGEIVKGWGINSPDLFASATLMRPYTGGDKSTSESIRGLTKKEQRERAYEMQMQMRKGMKQILGDESKWPRELIFIGRNLRIVQGNNQFLGSPVNRIKITGTWASRALTEDRNLTFSQRWRNYGDHVLFRTVLLGSDFVFWYSKVRQWIGWGKGMDDDIEESMKSMAKEFGIEMQHGVFDG